MSSLRFLVEEFEGGASTPLSKHVRHVMVEHAPALFLILCGDPACRDGGHELTHEILTQLRRGNAEFELEDACHGVLANGPCRRSIRLVATCGFTR